jgi:hypothetical protein
MYGLRATDPAAAAMVAAPQQQPEFYDEWEPYVFDTDLTALQEKRELSQLIGDTEFLWTCVWGNSDGAYQINIKKPNGRLLFSSMVNNVNFIGTAAFPVNVKPAVRLVPNSRLSIDITDTSNAANTVQIVFGGFRRYPLSR